MELDIILSDKSIKPKEKTEKLSQLLLTKAMSVNDLLVFADSQKDPAKATCIEAVEYATKQKPDLADLKVLDFVTKSLASKAPRVKWESAKVIGNIAHLFSDKLDSPITGLLNNTEHSGTVVRWSSAFALGEILKLKTIHNSDLLPAIEQICENEEKNSIRKIYLEAIKKVKA